MRINETEVSKTSGFYVTTFEAFAQTLEDSNITEVIEMGGVVIHCGTHGDETIWLADNPAGSYAIWVEEKGYAPSEFSAVSFATFAQIREDTEVIESYELGGGVAIRYGTRNGQSIWLMDNPMGKLYGVWNQSKNERSVN